MKLKLSTTIPRFIKTKKTRYRNLLTLSLIFIFVLLFSISNAQNVNLNLKNASLEDVLNIIEKQTGFHLVATSELLKNANNVTINVKNETLKNTLILVFKNQPIDFNISDNYIVLSKQKKYSKKIENESSVISSNELIKGIVRDSLGNPIESVGIKRYNGNKTLGTTKTDFAGKFAIAAEKGDKLEFTHVSFEVQDILIEEFADLNIVLKSKVAQLDSITMQSVNTGMFSRNKNTYTGSTATYTGDQLRSIGVQNVLQSLKTLDPSFLQVANTLRGSDPNTLGTFQIRGQSGISTTTNTTTLQNVYNSDPNQPLFILNGMQSTLQQITDLDINRIASVTVLRDAASTALYGDKAANGVVVVETKKPKAGKLGVSYTMNGTYSFPDFSSYNFMDALQNYQFQLMTGIFTPEISTQAYYLDSIKNARYAAVLGGVNNNWLNVPIRNAFTEAHSLSIYGGDESILFNIDLNYKDNPGVMKESGRKTYGATINLQYRHNKLNVSNSLYLNGYKATTSPWGSFSQYAQVSPLFNILDSNGNLNRSPYLFRDMRYLYPSLANSYTIGGLATSLLTDIPNPIYNATLNSFNYANQSGYIDNFNLIYDILPFLRFQTGLQLTINKTTNPIYDDPLSTDFTNTATLLKGAYSNTWTNYSAYEGNAMFTFNKVFNHVHSLTANLRTDITNNKTEATNIQAVGFPTNTKFSLANAFSYVTGGRPSYIENIASEIQNVFSFNYAYKLKYLLDFTFNQDGTSNFGTNKLYKTFVSAGIGWNIHKEDFLAALHDKITLLRLRANIGTSGNQNLGAYPSNSIYSIIPGSNPFGLSYNLTQLGTPNLDWQVTRQTSVGLDFDLFHHFISGYFNLYDKLTNPLTIYATLPPSSGVATNPLNIGKLSTRGFDFALNVSPIYNLKKNRIWTIGITGSSYRAKYKDIGNKLSYQNNLNASSLSNSENPSESTTATLVNTTDFLRYTDGNDPNEIWAVRSLGIDPTTGKELYLSKSGVSTFTYNPEDAVPLGSSLPSLQGVISNTLQWGALSCNLSLRYSLKATQINYGLYNYAENISEYQYQNNQDVRTLLRWNKPGDIAPFASFSDAQAAATYPLTSRFISKESFLSGESFSIGYQILDKSNKILRSIHAQALRFTLYMNDIFYLSNVKLERGIDYPYAKSVSLGLSASF